MKKLICKIFGHIKTGERHQVFEFSDGMISWGTECPRCKTKLMCVKGYVPNDPEYVCSTELSNQNITF